MSSNGAVADLKMILAALVRGRNGHKEVKQTNKESERAAQAVLNDRSRIAKRAARMGIEVDILKRNKHI
jgi:hypothetical protein